MEEIPESETEAGVATMPITARRTAPSVDVCRELEQFLFEEADLLDTWQFDAWLTMLADDIHYWAPVRENLFHRQRKNEMAAPGGSAHFDETREHLAERVDRLKTHQAWAEEPASRTRHLVTNIRVFETDNPDEFEVESSFYVFRTRSERDFDSVVGKRFDVIRRVDDSAYGFQLARRKIVFDMAMLLVKNLSLFY
ncbi:3-phenylpropionate/cinnamic acid dioxygenase subunit beta [Ammonicoccus fulvus]|uniref:3-phenylpropionate/cinnamic acid dioxygenase subunit beta n=1 Tax=Ammonicoccus fulvus TaxID=3138240 RepID=A0ABZ3FJA4_9ACTN